MNRACAIIFYVETREKVQPVVVFSLARVRVRE